MEGIWWIITQIWLGVWVVIMVGGALLSFWLDR